MSIGDKIYTPEETAAMYARSGECADAMQRGFTRVLDQAKAKKSADLKALATEEKKVQRAMRELYLEAAIDVQNAANEGRLKAIHLSAGKHLGVENPSDVEQLQRRIDFMKGIEPQGNLPLAFPPFLDEKKTPEIFQRITDQDIKIKEEQTALLHPDPATEAVIFMSRYNPEKNAFDLPAILERKAEANRERHRAFAQEHGLPDADRAEQRFPHRRIAAREESRLPDRMREYGSRAPIGIEELRKAFGVWLKRQKIEFPIGMKERGGGSCVRFADSINNTLLPKLFTSSLFEKGDEVLFCSPIYGMLPGHAYQAGMHIVNITGDKANAYKPNPDRIREALRLHPDARALMVVNPANPTGVNLAKEEVDAIASVIAEHNQVRRREGKRPLLLIADETFDRLTWIDNTPSDAVQKPVHRFAADKAIRNDTISLGTFSKAFAPGLGFAYAYGHPDVMAELKQLDGPSLLAQEYAHAVFSGDSVADMHKDFDLGMRCHGYKQGYDALVGHLYRINQKLKQKFGKDCEYIIPCNTPEAGFHMAVDCSGLKGFKPKSAFAETHAIDSSFALASELLSATGVSVYPGEMFYMDGKDMIMRLSLHVEPERTAEAMRRLESFCLALEPPNKWADKVETRGPSIGPAI